MSVVSIESGSATGCGLARYGYSSTTGYLFLAPFLKPVRLMMCKMKNLYHAVFITVLYTCTVVLEEEGRGVFRMKNRK